MPNHYSLLQLSPDATAKAIRSAYRKLVKTCHPDLHPNNPELKARFIELTLAYETLSDPQARKAYDESQNVATTRPETTQYYKPRDPEAFFRQFQARHGSAKKEPRHIEMLRAIVFSPITYCLLVFIFMVIGFKMVVDAVALHFTHS